MPLDIGCRSDILRLLNGSKVMLIALLLAATGPNAVITGDFDRDGKMDRAVVSKYKDKHKIMMFRSFLSAQEPVELGIDVDKNFALKKVNRTNRRAACEFASLSRYTCDAGDVLQYGDGVHEAMAVWNGQRFIVYRPPVPAATAPAQ